MVKTLNVWYCLFVFRWSAIINADQQLVVLFTTEQVLFQLYFILLNVLEIFLKSVFLHHCVMCVNFYLTVFVLERRALPLCSET